MPKKRVDRRQVVPVFKVFCEGEKTERNYFDWYVREICRGRHRGRPFRLKELWNVCDTKNRTDPNSLVNMAVAAKEKSPCPCKDRFWCVYDRESRTAVLDRVHEKAFTTASQNGIEVAFSNVCFEVWLLLHKQDSCADYASYSDLEKRSKLKKYFPNYKKSELPLLKMSEVKNARKAAPLMNKRTKESMGRDAAHRERLSPYTDVYKLLDSIDAFFSPNNLG